MASGNAPCRLYDALTGASVLIDAGEGTRQKAWLDEIPRWLMEASERVEVLGLDIARRVNFPAFIEGDRELTANPIGGNVNPLDAFNGIEMSEVVPNRIQIGLGDGSETDFGGETLTAPDPAALAYATNGTDGGPPLPRGGAHPAFLTSEDGSSNFNLGATSGDLLITVNGAQFTVDVGTGAATTPESIVAAVINAGVPVQALIADVGVTDRVRLLTLGVGVAQTIRVDGDVAAVVFASSDLTDFRGAGGPLNDLRALSVGVRPQRRILPGSIQVSATIGAATVLMTDDGAGALADDFDSPTHTGTIDYATGAIDIDYGTAPDNATAVIASYKALLPLTLSDPVRIPPGGKELALRVL